MDNRILRMGLSLGVFLLGEIFEGMRATQQTDTEEAELAVASRRAIG
jgi:hypothetical protein